jgi:hypothetical protein
MRFSKNTETSHRFIDKDGHPDYDPEFSAPLDAVRGEGVAAVRTLGGNWLLAVTDWALTRWV